MSATVTTTSALEIDKTQATKHLEALGYRDGDAIFTRAFYPNGDPRGKDDKGRKGNKLDWNQLQNWQNEGRGIYFVVNGGGHTDKEVSECRALFCEFDDRPLVQQIDFWKAAGLPEPSIQIQTRKSVHTYWVFEQPVDVEVWRQLTVDLIQHTGADPVNKNPSRVLRLAGAHHIKPEQDPLMCTIASQSGQKYSYDQLRAAIPVPALPALPVAPVAPALAQAIKVPAVPAQAVPIYQCLTKDDQKLIDGGKAEGSRNNAGAKLARNLIGTERRLQELGIAFEGSPRGMFDSFCNRCSPLLESAEADKIWDYAFSQSGLTASLSDEAIQNCVAAWERSLNNQHGTEKPEKTKPLSPKEAADLLISKYRDCWKYDLQQQTWRRYNGQYWQSIHKDVFGHAILQELEQLPGCKIERYDFVENVVKFLRTKLLAPVWKAFNRLEWIAFNDCVYEVATGLQHPHSEGFGFTSCLEHDFPKLIAIDSDSVILDQLRSQAPTFWSWAFHAQKGDPLKVLKLIAIINGIVKYRFFDLQMFVHLCGVPGAGKGTFARLLETIVGKQNRASARLSKLNDDNTIAKIIDKQLVICPDERKQVGEFSGLLSLTGGDSISYRRIYQESADANFYGTLVVVSNNSLFAGDATGIDRRLCLVTFDVPIIERDSAIEGKIQAEAANLTAIALMLPNRQATDLIRGTGKAEIPDFKRMQWLHKTENDSIALFLEEYLAPGDKDDFIWLGGKGSDATSLYGAYFQFCEENNSKSAFTVNNFRSHFTELAKEVGWAVEAKRATAGWRIYGVKLRTTDTAVSVARVSESFLENVDHVDPCRVPCRVESHTQRGLCRGVGSNSIHRVEKFESSDSSAKVEISEAEKLLLPMEPQTPYTPTYSVPSRDSDPTCPAASAYMVYIPESLSEAENADLPQLPGYTPEIGAAILVDHEIENWEMVLDLTEVWSQDFKAAAWSFLPGELRHKLRQLKALYESPLLGEGQIS